MRGHADMKCLWFLSYLFGPPGIHRCTVVRQDATAESEAFSFGGLSKQGPAECAV